MSTSSSRSSAPSPLVAPPSPPLGSPSLLRTLSLACFPPSPRSSRQSTRTRCGAGTWSPRES
eukprot:965362-Pleurochrysis_carterae.AAC.1